MERDICSVCYTVDSLPLKNRVVATRKIPFFTHSQVCSVCECVAKIMFWHKSREPTKKNHNDRKTIKSESQKKIVSYMVL